MKVEKKNNKDQATHKFKKTEPNTSLTFIGSVAPVQDMLHLPLTKGAKRPMTVCLNINF
jgi:hypothetical protein